MAGRCLPPSQAPVELTSRRLVLEPVFVSFASGGTSYEAGPGSLAGAQVRAEQVGTKTEDERLGPPIAGWAAPPLPETFPFGRRGAGRATVVLRFQAGWRAGAVVRSAYLLLDAAEGAVPPERAVVFEVAGLPRPASQGDPGRGAPSPWYAEVTAALLPIPPAPMRIDVSDILRRWAPGEEESLAVSASGDDPRGVAVSLGVSQGAPPRLEVYVN